MQLLKEHYILLSIIFGGILFIASLLIFRKSRLSLNLDIKNKKIEMYNKEKDFTGEGLLIEKNYFVNLIDEVSKISGCIEHLRKETLAMQMTYAKRKIQIHINNVLSVVSEILNIEENSTIHKILYLYYANAEKLLIDETRSVLKRNHLIDESEGDWKAYKDNIQDYIFETVEDFAIQNFQEDTIGIKRSVYKDACHDKLKDMHEKVFVDILDKSLNIAKINNIKIASKREKINNIKTINKGSL